MKKIVILFFSILISISAYNQDFVNGHFSGGYTGWEVYNTNIWRLAINDSAIIADPYYGSMSLNVTYYIRQTIKNLNPIGEYNVEFDLIRWAYTSTINDTIDITTTFLILNYDTLCLYINDTLTSYNTVHFSSEFFNYQVSNTDSLQFSVNFKRINTLNIGYIPKMVLDNFKLTQTNVGLRPENYSESFRIFPNPSAGEFSILYETNSEETKQVTIYSTIGKLIYSDSFTGNNFKVSNAGLSRGVYFVMVENEGRKTMRKLVVY